MPETAVDERAGGGRRKVSVFETRLGVLTWLAPVLVITILVAIDPLRHTVTPLYHAAAAAWWAAKDLYQGPGGMNYLPQFAVIFSPFHWLPVPMGDILWRFFEAALLAAGVWSFCWKDEAGSASCSTLPASRSFLYASLLAMPLCLASLRNGQANGLIAGLGLYASACLARQRWWAAAALIVLSIGIKPLGIVMVMLAAVVYAPLRRRLLPALAALALFPFLFAPAGYVTVQFHAFFANIGKCAAVHDNRFADIGGIVRAFGLELPGAISTIARFAAGGIFLVLWLMGAKRLREPFRAMWLLALYASYLMLFNPMNEANSYAILAPALGLWAVAALGSPSLRWFGWLSVAICLSMSLLPNLLHPVFGNHFALFWHPVMTVLFIFILAWLVLRAYDQTITGSWSPGAGDPYSRFLLPAPAFKGFPMATSNDFFRPYVSFLLPCYNESAVIAETYRRVKAVGDSLERTYEIVFVNDGSTDDTLERMLVLSRDDPTVTTVDLSRNHGHQLALSAGLHYCTGERVLIMDADLQDPPELLPRMLAMMDEGAEVVYAQRRSRPGDSLPKRAACSVFYRFLGMLTEVPIPVDTGDFRLISRRVLEIILQMPERHRFIRGMVSWVGFRQAPILYDRDGRFAGETKYPFWRLMRLALDGIVASSVRPLALASWAGLLFAACSLVLLGYILWSWLFVGKTPQGWASLMMVVTVMGAIQLFVLGIIGQYLGRMHEQVRARPIFIVKDVFREGGGSRLGS